MRIQTVIKKAIDKKGVVTFFRESEKTNTYTVDIYSHYPRDRGNGLGIINRDGELAVLEIEDILATDWGVKK